MPSSKATEKMQTIEVKVKTATGLQWVTKPASYLHTFDAIKQKGKKGREKHSEILETRKRCKHCHGPINWVQAGTEEFCRHRTTEDSERCKGGCHFLGTHVNHPFPVL
jgi:hypothetical protein